MESRYKYLYDEQAVHVAFMGAVQAYTTMFTRRVLSAETAMSNLSDELKAAQDRLDELHAMEECKKTFPPISEHKCVVPIDHKGEQVPVGERLCDFFPTLHSGEDADDET